MFLENETWELCPVKSNFNIAQLHVSQHHKTEGKRGENPWILTINSYLTEFFRPIFPNLTAESRI